MNNTTQLTAEFIRATYPGLVDDLSVWAEYGITTVGGLADHLDIEAAHNVYKDRNGFRPRFIKSADDARRYLDDVAAADKAAADRDAALVAKLDPTVQALIAAGADLVDDVGDAAEAATFRDFPDDRDAFDMEAQDEMAADDLAGRSFEQAAIDAGYID